MKRLLIALGFALLSTAAWAGSEIKDGVAAEATASAAPAAAADDAKAPEPDDRATAKADDRNCLRHTGSRIPRKDKNDCINAPGRSYSKDDLDRTGAITVAEALERLDPSVTIRH